MRCAKCGRENVKGVVCACQTQQGSWSQFGQPTQQQGQAFFPQEQQQVQQQQLNQGQFGQQVPQFGQIPQPFGQPNPQTSLPTQQFGGQQVLGFGQSVAQFGDASAVSPAAYAAVLPSIKWTLRVLCAAMVVLCAVVLVFNVIDIFQVIDKNKAVSIINNTMMRGWSDPDWAYIPQTGVPGSVMFHYCLMAFANVSGIALGIFGVLNAAQRRKSAVFLAGAAGQFLLSVIIVVTSFIIRTAWVGAEGVARGEHLQYFLLVGTLPLLCLFVAFIKKMK